LVLLKRKLISSPSLVQKALGTGLKLIELSLKTASLFGKLRYSKEKLAEIRSKIPSEIDFNREYLCSLAEEGTAVIPLNLIVKAFDEELSLIERGEEGHTYYTGVDFAMSPRGDYSAFITVDKVDGKIRIRNIIRGKGIPYNEQEAQIKTINALFSPVKILLDKSLTGSAYLNSLMAQGLPVEGFSFTPENRNAILKNLAKLFYDGKIVIPRSKAALTHTIMLTDQLVKELSNLVIDTTRLGLQTFKSIGKYDDCLMALALACHAATREGKFLSYIRVGGDLRRQSSTSLRSDASLSLRSNFKV